MIRLSAAPADGKLQEAAEAWRSSDAAHDLAWRQANRAWRAVALAQPDEAAIARGAARTARDRPISRRSGSRWIAVAVSIIVVAALSSYVGSVGPGVRADHATSAAEHRNVSLQDGSVIELGGATALDVRFDDKRRSIELLAGEAFFRVTHGDTRPFVVLARGVSVLVTGTAFNVRVDEDAVAVAVERGSVEVDADSATAARPIRMRAGDQMVARRRDGLVERSIVASSDVGSWRRYRMFVDGATVGDVVNELRRYHGGWIVVVDGDLLKQQVTGLYDLRDPGHALRVLVGPFGASVRSVSPLLTVVSSF